jgi:hypothetical protein
VAYVLGFFVADGNMIRTRRGGYYISFEIIDLELLLAIRKILGVNNKISARRRMPKYREIYRLQIGSKAMYNDLALLGLLPCKSLIMPFPDIPEQYLSDFTRGYFDGDGCVHFGRYWRKDRQEWKLQLSTRFTSGNETFLKSLWDRLRPPLDGGYLYKKERGFELVFGQHDSIALFHFMYDNSSELFLLRKYQKFQFAFKELGLLRV